MADLGSKVTKAQFRAWYLEERAKREQLEAENARLNMEMVAYRDKLTPADAAAMVAVINALYAEKAARHLKHATWFDGGYLGNGNCSFMWARSGAGACCNLPHGHEGPHREDSPQSDRSAE
jgi:hypothetical protein